MMKSEMRKSMIAKRHGLTQYEVIEKSNRIVAHIREDKNYQEAKYVAIFFPMGNEVNVLSLVSDNKQFCFPKVEKDGIHFYVSQDFNTFTRSPFGVLEPTCGELCDHKIDYMLVPALAISASLYRVGYGKGYYDRFLSIRRPNHVIGVAYDFQLDQQFEIHEHDQKLDRVIWG